MDGIELVRQLTASNAGLVCVMYSGHSQDHHVQHALSAGARGYLLKGEPWEMVEALPQIMSGVIYPSPALRQARSGSV